MDALEDFRTLLARAHIEPEKPLYMILMTVYRSVLALDQKPVADVERAVRQSLNSLRPAYERRWRWQTVARVVGIGIVALAAWSAAGGWIVGRIYYDLGAAESHHWTAWCASPSHIATIGGKQVCQVPVQ